MGGGARLRWHAPPAERAGGLARRPGRGDEHPKALAQAGAWHFCLERPGFGLSDPQPGRRLLDWPVDVAAFADSMGIDRFAVIGTSAGAPYALACGHAMPDRVTAVALQCGWSGAVDDPTADHLLPDDWREAIQRYRTDPCGVLAEDEQRLKERAERWAADPRGLYAELFSDGPDGEIYERFRIHWMRILAATYGTTPSTDEHRVMYEPWGSMPHGSPWPSTRGTVMPTPPPRSR